MRFFYLHRKNDVSGVSGTGIIAHGVEFDHGMCAFTWISPYHKVDIAANVKTIEQVHGHGGDTQVIYHDPAMLGEKLREAFERLAQEHEYEFKGDGPMADPRILTGLATALLKAFESLPEVTEEVPTPE
jgi:hypothetical protein